MNSQSGGKYKLRQLSEDLAHIDKGLLDLLENHEERLQVLEKPDVKANLCCILDEIGDISNAEKRNLAMGCFAELVDALVNSGIITREEFGDCVCCGKKSTVLVNGVHCGECYLKHGKGVS